MDGRSIIPLPAPVLPALRTPNCVPGTVLRRALAELAGWLACLQTHDYQTVIMVGDGITDFEARAPGGADAFIGCAGRGLLTLLLPKAQMRCGMHHPSCQPARAVLGAGCTCA